jgi:hypothetical protein
MCQFAAHRVVSLGGRQFGRFWIEADIGPDFSSLKGAQVKVKPPQTDKACHQAEAMSLAPSSSKKYCS